jgi:hypothetical protein
MFCEHDFETAPNAEVQSPGGIDKRTSPRAAFRAYVPANLSFDCLPDEWRDYIAWLVGRLYLYRHLDKRYRDGNFSPLYSKVLEKVLPKRSYRTILGHLTENGVIESNNWYTPGRNGHRGRAKGFRLAEQYRNAAYQLHDLRHPELVRKLTVRKAQLEENHSKTHGHLRGMLEGLEVVGSPPADVCLATIHNGDFRFKVCAQGRVHTQLTNLAKTLRQHLRW